MLSNKAKDFLEDLVQLAINQDYQVNSITFYNVFADLPEDEKNDDTILEMEDYLSGKNISIVSDSVELDGVESTLVLDQKIKPFDPSKIDINMKTLSLDAIVKRLKNEEMNLNTDFQRKAGLWTDVKKSQLIESILLKIPLPAFYFDASKDDNWLIIDGLQRVTALKEFIVDKSLKLKGMEFFSDLDDLTYNDLPRPFVRRIDETILVVYMVNKSTPKNVKYNIFKRINTGGLELSPQEIRHALYFGPAVKFLKKLSSCEEFLKTTCHSIKTDRMLDQEFVLRFVGVCCYGIEKYEGSSDDFLNETMEYINALDIDEMNEIEGQFIHTMDIIYRIFGNHSFRKMAPDGRRRPINKAVFETWCKVIIELDEKSQDNLVEKKDVLKQKYIDLCESRLFSDNIKASDKYAVNRRIALLEKIVDEVLTC